MFLIFGGTKDINLQKIIYSLDRRNIIHSSILLDESYLPKIIWDMDFDRLIIGEKIIKPSSIFLRNDVFNSLSNSTISYTWYKTLRSWGLSHENTTLFNKGYIGMDKARNLMVAKSIGLSLPHTLITNDIDLLSKVDRPSSYITKPLTGGQYTITLKQYLDNGLKQKKGSPPLTYLQNRLIQPEVRIFGIGKRQYAFSIQSLKLDYRSDSKTKIIQVPVPKQLSQKLEILMQNLQLDFGAADFKTCPKSGQLLFLEINSSPMFSRFDEVSKGQISNAIIDWHLENTK